MAGRGSAIGMSAAAGIGTTPGLMGDMRGGTSTLYGGSKRSIGNLQVHHWLWVLVLLEVGTLFLLRFSFRRYHGG